MDENPPSNSPNHSTVSRTHFQHLVQMAEPVKYEKLLTKMIILPCSWKYS